MEKKYKLLDLFCGAGGASLGYHLAGFEVTGVDLEEFDVYPFEFFKADAMEFDLSGYDAIHASPPCQNYSRATKHLSTKEHKSLIPEVRKMLNASGVPYVIENVPGAPLINPLILCGTMLGLRIYRHRMFESNINLSSKGLLCDHTIPPINPNDDKGRERIKEEFKGIGPDAVFNQAMGLGWLSKEDGRQAIPPKYTEFIGLQLIEYLKEKENGIRTPTPPL
jgi:DNA (cytosine-5)-methyltransferase 1